MNAQTLAILEAAASAGSIGLFGADKLSVITAQARAIQVPDEHPGACIFAAMAETAANSNTPAKAG